MRKKYGNDFIGKRACKDKAFKTMMTSGILEQVKLSAFAKKFFSEEWSFADIPEEYYEKKDGIMLMSGGKIRKANEGCACTMNSIIEQFINHLQLGENEVALLDMEAGVEHFGRGTDNGVDKIVMIVDPSYESLQLSRKIKDLAESIGKPVYYVLNKVTEENQAFMMDTVVDQSAVAACIPLTKKISEAGLCGKELTEREPEVEKLAKRLFSDR